MRSVFSLGPARTGEGTFYSCFALDEEQLRMGTGKSRTAALADLVARGGTEGATCEPALRTQAKKHGLAVGPLPEQARDLKAVLAVDLDHNGRLAGPAHPELVLELLAAGKRFEEAAPWEVYGSNQPLRVRVQGALRHTFEACVLGAGEEEYGLALYFEQGAAAESERLFDEGHEAAAQAIDTLTLLLDDEPRYVADAVRDVVGLGYVPHVMRVRKGAFPALTPEELAALTAALDAVVALARGEREGHGVSSAGPRVEAFASEQQEPAAVRAAEAWGNVGRNAPCPCGSGKKYKACHGQKALEPRPLPAGASRWHSVDRPLVERLHHYAEQQHAQDTAAAAAHALFGDQPVTLDLLVPWWLFEYAPDGRSLGARYLAEHGAALSEDERRWLSAQLAARVSVHEVLSVQRGKGLELVDLFTGARAFVHEVSGSRTLGPRDGIVARVVTIDDEHVFSGFHARVLPPDRTDEVLTQLGGGPTTGQPLRETPPATALVPAWDAAWEAYERERTTPGKLLNTDDEPVVLVEDHFRIKKGVREELTDLLAGLEGAYVNEDRARSAQLTFTRPGNRIHPKWERTSIGDANVTGSELVLMTNSEARADALRQRVEAVAGPRITFQRRERTAPPTIYGRSANLDTQYTLTAPPADPEAQWQELHRAWLDQPSPDLEGHTPREAAKDERLRHKVHRLLRLQENLQAHTEDPSDLSALRREVGLDVFGQPLPHHDLDLALGAGRRISECLLDVAQPLLDEAADLAEARAVLSIAVDVWNAAVADAQDPTAHQVDRMRGRLLREGLGTDDLDRLLARRRERHAADLRTIEEWSLHKERGGFNLIALGTVSPELARRARDAGLVPPISEL